MNIMIASDIHGSAYYCGKMLEAFDREQSDKLLLLGDLLYHGPRNDLPRGYDPKEVIALLNARKERILCVRGNCDTEVDQMVLEFPIMADYCILFAGQHMIFATHGHRYHKDAMPPLGEGDILLHGHTHIPAWEPCGSNLYLSPGAGSIPKGGSCHGYMLLSEKESLWKELEGEVYHSLSI